MVGRVQGVSFRYYTRRAAQELRLSGWVKNLPDGSVEVMAHGERAALETLRAVIGRGPARARVERVEDREWVGDHEPEGLFEIRF